MTGRYGIPFEIDEWRIITNGIDALLQMKGVLVADNTVERDTFTTPGTDDWDIVSVPTIEYMTLIDDEGKEVEAVVKGKDTGKIDVDRVLSDWINTFEFNEWLHQKGRDIR